LLNKQQKLKIIDLHWKDTLPIRHKVLWPNELPEFCMVDGDADALHFGVTVHNEIICVASLYLDGRAARLRKFATLSRFQGKGIGSYMLNFLVEELKKHNINYLWFDARESAIGFYKRLGFHSTGNLFYKKNISYYKMYANLSG